MASRAQEDTGFSLLREVDEILDLVDQSYSHLTEEIKEDIKEQYVVWYSNFKTFLDKLPNSISQKNLFKKSQFVTVCKDDSNGLCFVDWVLIKNFNDESHEKEFILQFINEIKNYKDVLNLILTHREYVDHKDISIIKLDFIQTDFFRKVVVHTNTGENYFVELVKTRHGDKEDNDASKLMILLKEEGFKPFNIEDLKSAWRIQYNEELTDSKFSKARKDINNKVSTATNGRITKALVYKNKKLIQNIGG